MHLQWLITPKMWLLRRIFGPHFLCRTLGRHLALSRRQERFTTHMQEELGSQFVQTLRGYLVQQESKRRCCLFVTRKGMVEWGKRKYRLLNLMIAIMRLENLKLRITMRERAMQTLIKRSSWIVGGKEKIGRA